MDVPWRMHLADRLQLPAPYTARPYRGRTDHPEMTAVLTAYREVLGDPEMPTVEQLDVTYAHLEGCDPDTDIAVVEHRDDGVVAYLRPSWADLEDGTRDCVSFAPTMPAHLSETLFHHHMRAQELHLRLRADAVARARYRAYAAHPGPDLPATGEAAWLESMGYEATEWGALLVRPHLDDIPNRTLPDGVELRPVASEQTRTIWDAHIECFRGEWDYHEPTDEQFRSFIEDPVTDTSLWQVAWAGDVVVGQVKPFINHDENAQRGYLRGYTEEISTHRDWRNRGIAGTLLARSLQELRDRGMTEAALGVDTNNPGGAFQLYTSLGFELQCYEAVYTKPVE